MIQILDEINEFVVISDGSSDEDDLDHLFCECNPDVALCGANVSDAPIFDQNVDLARPCVVCFDLEDIRCERCGDE